jgi:hypothetical protein
MMNKTNKGKGVANVHGPLTMACKVTLEAKWMFTIVMKWTFTNLGQHIPHEINIQKPHKISWND